MLNGVVVAVALVLGALHSPIYSGCARSCGRSDLRLYVIIGLLAVFSTCANLQSPSHVRRAIDQDRQRRRRRRDLVTKDDIVGDPKEDEAAGLDIGLAYAP